MQLEFKNLTCYLFGVSFALGAKKGIDMVYMKYLLSKTGMFPKWEPQVSDVLRAAFQAHEIKNVITPSGKSYYYVIPADSNFRHVYELVRVFRANGIILMPHRSRKYNSIVFRVHNRGQRFMYDAMRVNLNAGSFQDVLAERKLEMPKDDPLVKKLFGKFEKER